MPNTARYRPLIKDAKLKIDGKEIPEKYKVQETSDDSESAQDTQNIIEENEYCEPELDPVSELPQNSLDLMPEENSAAENK